MAGSSNSIIAANFKKFGFNASDEWFQACYEWCKDADPRQSPRGIIKDLREQWLNADIRVEGVQARPQLKPEWTQENVAKSVINGTLTLQVLCAVDIGQSAYSQLQTMLKVKNENTMVSADQDGRAGESLITTQYRQAAWEPKPSRMLRLTLSDGFNKIDAIEHETIVGLKYPVAPGCKVQIRGPVVCRRGAIMLTRASVTMLKGDGDREGVEDMAEEFEIKKILAGIIGTENVGQADPSIPVVDINAPPGSRPAPLRDRTPLQNNAAAHNTGRNSFSDPFADEDDDLFSEIDLAPPPPPASRPAPSSNMLSSAGEPPVKKERKYIGVNPKPFQYLKTCSRTTGSEVVLKASVTTLTSRLSTKRVGNSHCWHVSVAITDGSDTLAADLSSDLLNTWIGASPGQYGNMTRAAKEETKKSVAELSEKLLVFNGLVKVNFHGHSDQPQPVIVSMNNLNPGHLQQLKKRNKV